ncbi:MAG: DUF4446 family protein [Candidatus Eremiobacteraeota bacterium]|nr:DUF4446 family protein [Candidatus Eremiobacteraeota bacterium]
MGSLYAAAGAFVAALASIMVYHAVVVRPEAEKLRASLDVHDGLLAGGNGRASDRLAALETARIGDKSSMDRIEQRVRELEALAATDVSGTGFIRYDAFAGAGAGLSYALALLNRKGDGVVLTSIYSREDTRTFGKPVEGFKPTVQASDEELEAIERARIRK